MYLDCHASVDLEIRWLDFFGKKSSTIGCFSANLMMMKNQLGDVIRMHAEFFIYNGELKETL